MAWKDWFAVGLVAVVACLSEGRVSSAQDTLDPVIESLDAKVGSFLEAVSAGLTRSAYLELLDRSPLLANQAEVVNDLVEKTEELEQRYGEYRDFELIGVKRIGNDGDLVFMRYLYKCENFPVVWYFTFYRAPYRGDMPVETDGTWRVITVRFDTELELLALQNQ